MTDSDIEELLKEAGDMLCQKWKDYIMEGSNVQPLAASTVASKVAKGSSYPDIPLVDTQLMIESIESIIEQDGDTIRLTIGITNPARAEIAQIHEYGLGPPARPTLRPVIDNYQDKIIEKVFDKYFNKILEDFKNG